MLVRNPVKQQRPPRPAGSRLALTHVSKPKRASITASSAEPACAGHADRLVRLGPPTAAACPYKDLSRSPLHRVT